MSSLLEIESLHYLYQNIFIAIFGFGFDKASPIEDVQAAVKGASIIVHDENVTVAHRLLNCSHEVFSLAKLLQYCHRSILVQRAEPLECSTIGVQNQWPSKNLEEIPKSDSNIEKRDVEVKIEKGIQSPNRKREIKV